MEHNQTMNVSTQEEKTTSKSNSNTSKSSIEARITQNEQNTASEVIEDESTKKPLSVPLILQMPELERGCEVTSLAMILQYQGISVDKIELAQNITFVPFKENGLRGNMHKGFVGNIYTFSESGLGVYVEPIIELAKQYVPAERIVNVSKKPIEHLYSAIDKSYPVWLITNSWFNELPESQFYIWETVDGPMKVTYRQHSVVMTDYDDQYVYVNDPLQAEKNIPLNRENFEKAWIQMGSQAMYIMNENH